MKRIASFGIACALLLASSGAHAQTPKALQGFSVVLVLGEAQGSMPSDGLSAGARKALVDLKDFLPYKGYRVLDTQWIASGDASPNMQPSRGHVRGLDNQEYEFTLWTQFPNAGSRARNFRLITVPAVSDSASRKEEAARVAQLTDALAQARKVGNDKEAATLAAQLAQARAGAAGPQTLIETTLNIDVGETVVVGTSRVQGDKALIVLLTAVPK